MRLIDADALKEMIPTTSVDVFENCRNCSLLSEEQVDELIDMTPTVNSWIPCSERLPDEYDEYLCQDADGDRFVGWLESAEWCKEYVAKEKILAWMPLPEPYKGGDTNAD